MIKGVNEGPIAMCHKFLRRPEKFSAENVTKLRNCLSEFLQTSEEALTVNKTLIKQDQIPFQQALEGGLRFIVDYQYSIDKEN